MDGGNDARQFRRQPVLHFHRFKHQQPVADRNAVTHGNIERQHAAIRAATNALLSASEAGADDLGLGL